MKRLSGVVCGFFLIATTSVFVQVLEDSEASTSSYVPTFENKTGSGSNVDHFGVAYGAGVWVKGAGTSPLYSSNGGQDWTSATTNSSGGWYQNVEFVNNRFFALCVMYCVAGKQIQYSDNGMTWTTASVPTTNVALGDWEDVAYGNGVLVAISRISSGTGNRVLRSTDNGATWQVYAFPASTDTGNAIIYANETFIVVGNRTLRSTDGITWSSPNNTGLKDIAYGNGTLLAVLQTGNGSNHLYKSTNWGFSWSAVAHPSLGTSTQYVFRIRFGNGVFLFGSSTKFVTTVNGSSFSAATNWLSVGSGQWRGLGFGAGQFMAVGDTSNGGAYKTIASTDTPDTTAPIVLQQVPAAGASGVEYSSNIVLTFSENVFAVPGYFLTIKKVSDNSVVTSIDVASSQVTVSGATVTINPTAFLPTSTALYVVIERGAFSDTAGNSYAGISSGSEYQFTTDADLIPPTPPTTPDLATANDTGFSSSDNITSATSPQFRFQGTEVGGTITVTASRTGVSDKTCTRPGATYLDGCIMSGLTQGIWSVVARHTDVNGNISASSDALSVVIDTTAPSLVSISPSRDAEEVAVNTNIQLEYSEDVYAASGDFLVKSGGAACSTTDQTISATSSAVSVSENTVTLNPPDDLAYSTVQCLSFSAGVIKDIAGNNAPLHDPTGAGGVRFTTSAADVTPPTATITSPTTPAASRTLVFALVFDESISGLTSADFSNLGTANCTYSVPSSTGTSFSVTATCTSDGTVITRLAPNSVTDGYQNTGPTSVLLASSVTIDTTTPSSPTTPVTPSAETITPEQPNEPSSGTTIPVAGAVAPVESILITRGRTRTQTGTSPTSTTSTTTTTTLPTITVPQVADGKGALVVDGQRIEAVITREDNQLLITAGDLRARISAVKREGGRAPLDDQGRIRIDQGDLIEVEVTGFASDSQVEVRMYSDPVLLGRSSVSNLGNLLASYEIPESVEDGRHTVLMLGESRQRDELIFALAVFIGEESSGPPVLAYLVGIPLGLAVLGALIIPPIIRRRREEEQSRV